MCRTNFVCGFWMLIVSIKELKWGSYIVIDINVLGNNSPNNNSSEQKSWRHCLYAQHALLFNNIHFILKPIYDRKLNHFHRWNEQNPIDVHFYKIISINIQFNKQVQCRFKQIGCRKCPQSFKFMSKCFQLVKLCNNK